MKIFYDPSLSKWRYFEAPEKRAFTLKANRKPLMGAIYFEGHERAAYEKAYAEAKANALEVENDLVFKLWAQENYSVEEILDAEYFDWPGSAVIKDGKYILSI